MSEMMSNLRLPLLPMEVVTPSSSSPGPAVVPSPRAPVTEPPKATAPAASLPPIVVLPPGALPVVGVKDTLPLELKTDHVHTAHTAMMQTGVGDARMADTGIADEHGHAAFTLRAEPMPMTATASAGSIPGVPEPAWSVPAWFVDDDDVIRVGRAGTPELMERAALLMLLRQWGAVPDWPPTRPDASNADPAALASEQRLELLQVPLSAQELLKLDYPALVMRKSGVPGQPPRPVVVSRAIGDRVVLLDPGAGFVSRPVGTIDQELTGTVRLYWRPLNGWRWPGPINGEDPVVRWLQRQLREQKIYHGRLDGLVGPETEQALRQWAAQRGLTVAPTDPLLDLFISQLLAPSDFPHLSPFDSGPSLPDRQAGSAAG
jgi:hypothetical protein